MAKSIGKEYADGLEKPSKPSIHMRVEESMLPGIKKMNIDEEVEFVVKGKVTYIEKNEYDGGKMCCSMKITSIKEK
jgi:hypothetical protein